MNTNIVIIIQARMGSKRLPNKSLLYFNGYPIIDWIIERSSKSKLSNKVVVAIPNSEKDKILLTHLNKKNKNVFIGSEENVLERFYKAAEKHKATHIVRVCADNPLICSSEIDRLIKFYFRSKVDYAYNHIPKNNNYPDGIGAEIISFEILKMIYKKANKKKQFEHCFNYIWDNPKKFKIATFNAPNKIAFPLLKLDVDTYSDFDKLNKINFNIKDTAQAIITKSKKIE